MAFFRQHNLHTTDAHRKYTSRVAGMYKEKLSKQANAAMRKYGTDVSMAEIQSYSLSVWIVTFNKVPDWWMVWKYEQLKTFE